MKPWTHVLLHIRVSAQLKGGKAGSPAGIRHGMNLLDSRTVDASPVIAHRQCRIPPHDGPRAHPATILLQAWAESMWQARVDLAHQIP